MNSRIITTQLRAAGELSKGTTQGGLLQWAANHITAQSAECRDLQAELDYANELAETLLDALRALVESLEELQREDLLQDPLAVLVAQALLKEADFATAVGV